MSAFQKAVKTESKLLMAISGPSGSGKTYTALAFASELAGANGRIAVIDTEHGSASKYADLYEFDTMSMQPPYHPTRFAKGVQAAHEAGYDVLVIDSLTHAWAGTGGALELVDEASKRFKGNSYMAWGDVTPIYRGMIDTIVGAGLHVIVTMRSKTEYVLETNERGKTVPKKVGMAPISRDGVEYEFDVWMEMDIDNNGIVQKTRCPELTARVFTKPGAEVVDILKSWLSGEKAMPRPARVEAAIVEDGKGHSEERDMGALEDEQFDADLHALGAELGGTPVVVQKTPPAPLKRPQSGGGKLERPLSPEVLREALRARAAEGDPQQADEKKRLQAVRNMVQMFGEDNRNLVMEWLFDKSQSVDLTDGECEALRKWVAWTKDSEENWTVNEDSAVEAQAMVRHVLIENGQTEFDFDKANAELGLGK